MDGVVVGAIAPHGQLEDAPATRRGLEELARRVAAAAPEAIVLFTPHNVHVEGHLAVVTAATIGELPVERELAGTVLEAIHDAGTPVVGVSFGGNDPAEASMPLDWGTEIPLAFLPRVPVVVVSPARDRPLTEHVRAGEAVAAAARGRRIAVVASADHGHAHDPAGPYGFDPAAAEYDRLVQELVREGRLDRLDELTPLVERAKADSLWQLLLLQGALGDGSRAELLSYEAPTYFGMLCAVFA